MFLKDFASNNSPQFDKLNSLLKENYDLSVDKSLSFEELTALRTRLINEFNRLKVKESKTMQSPDLSKTLLLIETISCAIRENYKPRAYDRVLGALFDFALRNIHVGDSVDEAVADALKQYRSSKYRFPDFEVEFDLRNKIDSYIDGENMVAGDFEKERVPEMKSMNIKKLRSLLESELDQAEVIVAAKGFASELQDMIEKIGRMQNEDLSPVVDQMREAFGGDVATSFGNLMSDQLTEVMDELKDAKDKMDNSISSISEGGTISVDTDMDSGLEFDPEPEMVDPEADMGMDMDADDEFAGDDAMAGPENEPLGREMKEQKIAALKSQMEDIKESLRLFKESK